MKKLFLTASEIKTELIGKENLLEREKGIEPST